MTFKLDPHPPGSAGFGVGGRPCWLSGFSARSHSVDGGRESGDRCEPWEAFVAVLHLF